MSAGAAAGDKKTPGKGRGRTRARAAEACEDVRLAAASEQSAAGTEEKKWRVGDADAAVPAGADAEGTAVLHTSPSPALSTELRAAGNKKIVAGACFRCGQIGHQKKDCPQKALNVTAMKGAPAQPRGDDIGGGGGVSTGGGQKTSGTKQKIQSVGPDGGQISAGTSKGATVGVVNSVRPEDATAKDYYFDSYAHHGIHQEMLQDTVRTESYRDAIMNNPHLIKDKVVLDIGCGTGILSMFAAKAGAKHVYAIECSSIFFTAQEIVKANGLDERITLLHGKCEEVSLPVDQVDVILSEWMGYALLYESMLDSVIYARDKWLAPDGVMMPDKATLWMCGAEDADFKTKRLDWWNDVYGYDMSCIREQILVEPLVDTVPGSAVITRMCQIKSLDLQTVKSEQLKFTAPFRLQVARNDYLAAFCLYFDTGFTQCKPPIWFSTSPRAQYTHWRQSVFYLPDALVVSKDELVTGSLSIKPNAKNHRDMDFVLTYTHKGKVEGLKSETLNFRMR